MSNRKTAAHSCIHNSSFVIRHLKVVGVGRLALPRLFGFEPNRSAIPGEPHAVVGAPGLAPGRLGDFKSPGSAVPTEARRRELPLPAGLSPATVTFEASRS